MDPFSADITYQIEGAAEDPVDEHGKPNPHNTHAEAGNGEKIEYRDRIQSQQISTRYTEEPHGERGNDQGEAHIACGAERRGQHKANGPDESRYQRVIGDQLTRQLIGGGGEVIERYSGSQEDHCAKNDRPDHGVVDR